MGPSCLVVPLCTPVSPIVCRRRSPAWLLPPGRSRSSLLPRGNTPSGSVAPSWLLSPPSRKCGSPSRSSTRLAPASSTASASKSFVDSSTKHLRFSSLFLLSNLLFPSFEGKSIYAFKISQERFVPLKMPMLFLLYLFYIFFLKKKREFFFLKKKKKKKKKK